MNRLKLLAFLACFIFLSIFSSLAANAPQTAEQFSQTRDQLLAKGGSTALNADEHFSLATSLLGLGQFREALIVAKLGLGLTQSPAEKSVFYMAIAQCHGAMGNYDEAGAAALEGQRLTPLSKELTLLSKELAALRWAYFTKDDNRAQAKAAEDTLKQLYPSGRPVLSSEEFWGWVNDTATKLAAIVALYDAAKTAWERLQPLVQDVKRNLDTLMSNAKTAGTRAAGNVRIR